MIQNFSILSIFSDEKRRSVENVGVESLAQFCFSQGGNSEKRDYCNNFVILSLYVALLLYYYTTILTIILTTLLLCYYATIIAIYTTIIVIILLYYYYFNHYE